MSNNQWSDIPAPRMLHVSSGRHNFGIVTSENNYTSIAGSQQKRLSAATDMIQQQTHEAIKAATELNLEKSQDESSRLQNQLMTGKKNKIQSLIQHMDIICDGCLKSPIIGDRYKCMFCPNIDFCQDCKSLTIGQHDSKHPLICIRDSSLYTSSISIQNISELIHRNTRCVYCSASPIVGIRYQCIPCSINICEKCEFLCLHDISHKRLKIILPE